MNIPEEVNLEIDFDGEHRYIDIGVKSTDAIIFSWSGSYEHERTKGVVIKDLINSISGEIIVGLEEAREKLKILELENAKLKRELADKNGEIRNLKTARDTLKDTIRIVNG